jgi:hypothetical protein
METLAEQSLPVNSAEDESGLLTTESVIFAEGIFADVWIERVAEIPSIFLSVWTKGRYALRFYVTPSSDASTKIRVKSFIEAYESNVTKDWHICHSNGTLERELSASIRSKL